MPADSLASLKDELQKKGGSNDDWNMALHHGLDAGDLEWIDTLVGPLNAESYAHDLLANGRYLEYDCYDDRGRNQGRAILKVIGWEAGMPYHLSAEHVVASDGYYEWYAQKNLKQGKAIYHVCPTRRKRCSDKLPKGDGRVLIHLMRWRMVNPLIMKELDYSKAAAMQILREWVGSFVKASPPPAVVAPVPEGPSGLTGLDDVLQGAPRHELPQTPVVEEGDKTLRGSRAVGAFLHERAEKRRREEGQKKTENARGGKRSLKKGSPGRGRSREKKRRKREDSGRSSESSDSRSSMVFHEPSTRGGVDLRNFGEPLRKLSLSRFRNFVARFRNFRGPLQKL